MTAAGQVERGLPGIKALAGLCCGGEGQTRSASGDYGQLLWNWGQSQG
jgi:hypothetical protein